MSAGSIWDRNQIIAESCRRDGHCHFSIHNGMPPTFVGEEEPSQGQNLEEQPELMCTPNFLVEVVKNDLVLDCHYPEDEVGQEE